MMRIAFIDHYDSFSHNLIDWLLTDSQVEEFLYVPCDDATKLQLLAQGNHAIVLSPGPGRPEHARQTLSLVQEILGKVPILGVCLGHQILGVMAGGKVLKVAKPAHGSVAEVIRIDAGQSVALSGFPERFWAATYHSLCIDLKSQPHGWSIVAENALGEIQALENRSFGSALAVGVQFHPESFMSESMDLLRANWFKAVAQWASARGGQV